MMLLAITICILLSIARRVTRSSINVSIEEKKNFVNVSSAIIGVVTY